MKILGTYSIDYGRGFRQTKKLVSQSEFNEIAAGIKEAYKNNDNKKANSLEKEIKKLGNFFTDESMIFKSLADDTLHFSASTLDKEHTCYCHIEPTTTELETTNE